jgi:hypothetical protein
MKCSEILMFIDELSMRASTSFVHLYLDTHFYEVMPCLSDIPFILSDRFRQFCLQNVAAYWIFLIKSNEN